MTRHVNPKQIAAIRALKHLPIRDIAARVGRSVGYVHKVLAAVNAPGDVNTPDGATTMPQDAPPAPPTPSAAAAAKSPHAAAEALASDEATLTAALASLHDQRAVARATKDLARSIQIERAIADVTARRAKLRPPTPANPNDDPKWRELAWLCAFTGAESRPDDVVDAFAAGVTEIRGAAVEPAGLSDFTNFRKVAPRTRF